MHRAACVAMDGPAHPHPEMHSDLTGRKTLDTEHFLQGENMYGCPVLPLPELLNYL